ncbi:hypothetical protein HID58_014436 [Brassica napus]|uniref:Uncharacterized protein n=1 Tax=Brassica napus TaxID=3708 RepID=A0ABQ8DH45_BRANA|nr:hypothetical protein HID58_014436 [Brassica napus]
MTQRSNCGFGSVADNLVFHLELRSSTVARNAKIYLTRYLKTKAVNIDGAYFGTTFPHLLFVSYGNLKPQKLTQSLICSKNLWV